MAERLTTSKHNVSDLVAATSSGARWQLLQAWPPDVFAVTGVLLERSGAYRLAVSPPPGRSWPESGSNWANDVRELASYWAASAQIEPSRATAAKLPAAVESWIRTVKEAEAFAVSEIPSNWELTCALLALHAVADETCSTLASAEHPKSGRYWLAARLQLSERGTVARLPVDRIRVLPKLRTPSGGMTLRSLSRYLALLHADMETTWQVVPQRTAMTRRDARFRVLVLPWPATVEPRDFRALDDGSLPLRNVDTHKYGFFEFSPSAELDVEKVLKLVTLATEKVGGVDAIVLPEAAVDERTADELERRLWGTGVQYIISGVRVRAQPPEFGRNYVRLSIAAHESETWLTYRQDKHHRWCLDGEQVHQYHLGATLHPTVRWWEAIELPPRRRVFIRASEWLRTHF